MTIGAQLAWHSDLGLALVETSTEVLAAAAQILEADLKREAMKAGEC